MTPDRITRLISRRDKLTCRRDGRINWPALREIDALLSEVPAGQDNRVDLALGRPEAQLPPRTEYGPQPAPSDYRIANRSDNPNWHGVGAWFDEAAARTDADYQRMSEGRPDGIVEHDDALAGAWA